MASTISASRTMPSTRFTSTSLQVRAPRRRLCARLRKTPVPSSMASKGAMEKIQLSSAQRTKMPSERQMTHALQATRLGAALLRVASAAQPMARYQPTQDGDQGRDAQKLQQNQSQGSRAQCRVEALAALRCGQARMRSPRPWPAMAPARGQPAPPRGVRAAAAAVSCCPACSRVAEGKVGETFRLSETLAANLGALVDRGWPPREYRSPSARAAPIPAGWGASSRRRRCAPETVFRARSAYLHDADQLFAGRDSFDLDSH